MKSKSLLIFFCIIEKSCTSFPDEHVLELSKRITSGEELYNLGVKVLHLKEFKIKTVLYDHSNSIQAATHKLLSTWLTEQKDRQEAYSNLLTQMRTYQMNELAGDLRQWAEGSQDIDTKKGKIAHRRIRNLNYKILLVITLVNFCQKSPMVWLV